MGDRRAAPAAATARTTPNAAKLLARSISYSFCNARTIPVMLFGDNRSLSSPMSPRQLLGPQLLFRFGFEALVMNRARSLIGSADLPRDLLAERHAGHKTRRIHRLIEGRGLPRPGRRKGRPNTGEPSAGDQSITRGVGGVVAVHLANVFDATRVAHQQRHAFDQLRAIVGDDPGIGFEHLVHQLPAAYAVVIGRSRPR